MTVHGLLVDLSWELKVEGGVPLLQALVANTVSSDVRAKAQVQEIGVAEGDADAFRVRIGRVVAITADFRDGAFFAKPSDLVQDAKAEDLSRLIPLLPSGLSRGEGGPYLCAVRSDALRGRRFALERGEPPRIMYDSRDGGGPVYAERVFAAYDMKPWLRAEAPDFRTLFQADTCLAVVKVAHGRRCLVGVLPVWP
jgi:hypothetical protein